MLSSTVKIWTHNLNYLRGSWHSEIRFPIRGLDIFILIQLNPRVHVRLVSRSPLVPILHPIPSICSYTCPADIHRPLFKIIIIIFQLPKQTVGSGLPVVCSQLTGILSCLSLPITGHFLFFELADCRAHLSLRTLFFNLKLQIGPVHIRSTDQNITAHGSPTSHYDSVSISGGHLLLPPLFWGGI